MEEFSWIDHGNRRLTRDRAPDYCPVCLYSCEPQELERRLIPRRTSPELECVFQCPRQKCGHLFLARYELRDVPLTQFDKMFYLDFLAPRTARVPSLPSEVKEISEDFFSIFCEAVAVDGEGYTQVAGAGYRKALEFLIKDYCKNRNPDAADEIQQAFLMTCINDYVTDERVSECARLATWLGNDEVHYVRKWTTKDLSDLRTLIDLTVGWIHAEALTERYRAEMAPSATSDTTETRSSEG